MTTIPVHLTPAEIEALLLIWTPLVYQQCGEHADGARRKLMRARAEAETMVKCVQMEMFKEK